MAEEMPKRIELLFKNATDNIQFIKKQEWALTASALTAYGALAATFRYTHLAAPWVWLACFILGASVMFAGILLWGFSSSLENSRTTIDWIYEEHFQQETESLKKKKKLDMLKKRRGCDKYGIFLGLFFVILLGAAFAYATILASSCS